MAWGCQRRERMGIAMGSDERFYRRRLQEELEGARRAVTAEARARRQSLAEGFRSRLFEIEAARHA